MSKGFKYSFKYIDSCIGYIGSRITFQKIDKRLKSETKNIIIYPEYHNHIGEPSTVNDRMDYEFCAVDIPERLYRCFDFVGSSDDWGAFNHPAKNLNEGNAFKLFTDSISYKYAYPGRFSEDLLYRVHQKLDANKFKFNRERIY